jgi:hypothetical protein
MPIFFIRRVSPEIDRVASRLAARTHAIVGRMPSSGSSPPATATPEILNYTLAQVEAFLRAAERAERQHLADLLLVVAIGGQGESEAITRLQRALDRED